MGFFDFLTGGSGESGTTGDKTPANAPDFIKLWASMQHEMKSSFGIYKQVDGTPVAFNGLTLPQLTRAQAIALQKAWSEAGNDLSNALIKAGKSIATLNKTRQTFLVNYIDWQTWENSRYGGQTYLGKYMFAPATQRLFDVIGTFVRDLDNSLWSGYNIETATERMKWAIRTSPGGEALGWVVDKAKAGIGLLNPFNYLPKWIIPATIAGAVWWFAIRTPSRRKD